MMKLVSIALLSVLAVTSSAPAQSQKKSIEEIQKSVSEAYKDKTLISLDDKRLINGSLLLVIEHSLAEGKGQYVRRRFKTFAQLDEWLKKRETEEGAPFRQLMPLTKCARGRCKYGFDNGILHNQLYLHDLYYAFRKGQPYIVKLYLLDGD